MLAWDLPVQRAGCSKGPRISLTERCAVTLNRKEESGTHMAESADRRQFLRNAMRIGGAAALLLTSASRQMLASSLTLNEQEMEAARRARQAPGAPTNADRKESSGARFSAMGGGCNGSCEGECKGCSGACTHTCSSTCLGGCEGGCKGACAGGCKGGCEGTCQGTGVG